MKKLKITQEISDKLVTFSFLLSCIIVIRHGTTVHYNDFLGIESDLKGICGAIEKYIFGGISTICIPTFFIISGFLFYRNVEKYADLTLKIKSRIKSLLIPYIIWNVLGYLYFAFIMNIPFVRNRMNSEPVVWSLRSFGKNMLNPILPLWFVKDLIILTLFSGVILFIINKKYRLFLALCIMLLIMFYIPVSKHHIVYSTFFFTLGGGIKHLFDGRERGYNLLIKKWNVYITFCGFVVVSAGVCYDYIYRRLPMAFHNILLVIGGLFLWHLLDTINIQKKSYMGKSFFIYCSHSFLITVFKKMMAMITCNDWLLLIGSFLMEVITIIIIVITANTLEIKFPKVFGLITGGRN